MEITFNLKDAQAHIPNGRLMNLKDRLGWNDIEVSKNEFMEATKDIENMKFDINCDPLCEQKLKEFEAKKDSRSILYKTLVRNQIAIQYQDRVVSPDFVEKITEETAQIAQDVLSHEKVQAKLKKLQQLRQLNQGE